MNFKLFVENEEKLFTLLNRVYAEDLYGHNGATCFIYLEKTNTLYLGDRMATHSAMMQKYGLSTSAEKQQMYVYDDKLYSRFVLGRFGRVDPNDHLYGDIVLEISQIHPNIGLVACWGRWGEINLDRDALKKCVKALAGEMRSQIIGIGADRLPISKDYYVCTSGKFHPYQIGGNVGTPSNNIEKKIGVMAAELHLLPYDSPKRKAIEDFALKLAASPQAGEYKWFLSRVFQKVKSDKHPWQQSMEKEKMIMPGQKWWGLSSESISF
jgi:hypothetical protein